MALCGMSIFYCRSLRLMFLSAVLSEVFASISQIQKEFTVVRNIDCVSKKVPTFKLTVTLSRLNRFSKFLHRWKRMKFATKPMGHHSPHLSHFATIPWEIKNSNSCRYSADMKEDASILHSPLTLLFVHKFWYFRCLKMGCLSPYSLQINFLCHCSFGYLLLPSICGIENSSQQMLLQRLWAINMVFSDKDKILIRSLYLKGYTAKRLTDEFPEKCWIKSGVNKLL